MELPETQYSRSADGVHIAYQVLGDADLDLVVSPGFVSHLEHSWEEPHLARFFRRLASFSRLIVFDKRGTGMSDRPPDERAPLFEDRVNDIATLLDTVGSERAAVMGLSETGAVALLFAATYPDRTRAVIAYGAFAGSGSQGPIYPWVPDPEDQAWLERLEGNWGRGAMYLENFAPSLVGNKRYEEWYAKLERVSVSPGAAASLGRMLLQMDVRDILPTIRVPTLVLHKRDDRCIPLEEGRFIAEHVPGAKFVVLDGADHWPWVGHDEAVAEIQEFLTGVREGPEPDRAVMTVMFIDIVSSTERAAELGDRRWAALLEDFYAVVRRELVRFRGKEVDTAGDGFFATFDGPARAIGCGRALMHAVAELDLRIRIGVHTGECERIAEKVGGLGVVIGARVGALAGPGEILVSRTVKDLVVGSDVRFQRRGSHELKGVPGAWELYRVVE